MTRSKKREASSTRASLGNPETMTFLLRLSLSAFSAWTARSTSSLFRVEVFDGRAEMLDWSTVEDACPAADAAMEL